MIYLQTLDALYAVAVANLGPMDTGSFADFKNRGSIEGAKAGIENPILVIDIKFKEANELGAMEQPYQVREDEWRSIVSDSRTMAEFMPRVFVVDGEKYTAPI